MSEQESLRDIQNRHIRAYLRVECSDALDLFQSGDMTRTKFLEIIIDAIIKFMMK